MSKSLNEDSLKPEPDFQLQLSRKFEQTEMCDIFYNRYVKWVYILIMTVYGFQTQWASATISGSAWAANIPFNTSTLKRCSLDDFNTYFIPPDPECANAYRLCVAIYGVIVIILSLIELVDQKIIQITIGIMHFAALGCMMIFCVVRLIESNGLPPYFENSTVTSCNASSSHVTLGEAFYQFNFKPWLIGIPIFVYSQMTHMGAVTLSGPMRLKQYLKEFFILLYSSTFLIYFTFALVLVLYFQYCMSDTASLNWVSFLHHAALEIICVYSAVVLNVLKGRVSVTN